MRSLARRSALYLLVFSVLLSGCQSKLYDYADPTHQVSVRYPGNVDLFNDKDVLQQQADHGDAVDRPELLFVLATMKQSQLTVSVHQLPEALKLSADEYYEASTAAELARLGVNIVEPKSDVTIDGKTFQRVGFTLKAGEQVVRSRLFQHLDPKTGKVLVLTATALAAQWESEILELDPLIQSIKAPW
jgi:hypothetical protein